MKTDINKATTQDEQCFYSAVNLLTLPYFLKQHIVNQSIKRGLSQQDILAECVQYHKEKAGT